MNYLQAPLTFFDIKREQKHRDLPTVGTGAKRLLLLSGQQMHPRDKLIMEHEKSFLNASSIQGLGEYFQLWQRGSVSPVLLLESPQG